MKNYNINDMKRELVESGDFTKAEVDAMTASEVALAWMALPVLVF